MVTVPCVYTTTPNTKERHQMFATLTAAQLTEAREWLLELDGSSFGVEDQDDFSDMIQNLSAKGIYNAIARHYDGGWNSFLTVIA